MDLLIIDQVTINYINDKAESATVYFKATGNTRINLSGNVLIPPSEYTGTEDTETLKSIVREKAINLISDDPVEDDPATGGDEIG